MTDQLVEAASSHAGSVAPNRSRNPAKSRTARKSRNAARPKVWATGLVAGAAWLAAAAYADFVPDADDFAYTQYFAVGLAAIGAALIVLSLCGPVTGLPLKGLRYWGPWLVVIPIGLFAWEAVTAKLELLPRPFFVPPQSLIEVYLDDWPKLGLSTVASLKLLAWGYGIGAAVGVTLGVAIGWWRTAGYWAHPVLRFIGPLPATAWLPVAFFLFPSSWSASVFLLALATGFPVTILTWSGIASVNKDYYDIARTLGASQRFLVLKVAIPAALPHVFVGLFMGLGTSFAVLVVAEMLGVKAGLGWYLQWAQGWAAYANMYAALIVMALMCSGLVTLLFKIRDHLLSWQKELVRW
ncbi:binding-protein-dependent transport systems inner membrane component [Xanthobacter versatilis]|uniref:Binding-protein-dependent transport systems inner membrane component n=1 Tax=Xanthobacter autotrophicus (strain ATCC BAA-1158 / Py2) TaxID=78245 RepID=A7IJ23_XANP2|nr:binding-protein-dependent transport systems inner membrane component [Xanthobacter autotrophicus Py2]